jgi:membrane-bound lytic murein transglycosylase D
MSASLHRASVFACAVAIVLGVGAAAPAAAFPAEFEKPSAIAPNVAFWKKVYAEWRVDDIALHDEDDLGVVYTVLRVPKRGGKDAEGRTRPEAINAGRAKVEAALRALAKRNPKDDSGLEGLEREVFNALKNSKRPDKYARAHKIRGQNGLYERFVQGYANSGLYEQFISAELTRVGLPKELIGVAFVESLFYTGARSKVGAGGVWQFMSYTGKEYMQLNSVIDERYDPILATEAAAKYLKQAKKELSTWPLAVTSYNYGRGGMRALAKGAGTNDFNVILAVSKNKRFGFAARNYYASFLAVLEILDEQNVRFAGVKKKAPWSYEVARMPFLVFSTQLFATGHLDQATFESLNPGLTDEAAGGRLPLPHGMSVRLPKGKASAIITALNALPDREKGKAQRAAKAIHVASGKETIAAIAKKYGVSAEILAARTGSDAADVVGKGQRVAIPPPSPKTSLLPEARGMPLPPLLVQAPVLLADAAELLPEAVAAPKPRVGLSAGPTLTNGMRGTVSVGRVRSEALEPPGLPAVDVIAGGVAGALPAVDVLAGAITGSTADARDAGADVNAGAGTS